VDRAQHSHSGPHCVTCGPARLQENYRQSVRE